MSVEASSAAAAAASSSSSASQSSQSSTMLEPSFEREIAFFKKPPMHFLDDVINATGDYLCDALDVLEKAIRAEVSGFDEQVATGVDNVYKHLDKIVDKNFDIFELYVLKNILRVPTDVVLPSERDPTLDAPPTYTVADEQRVTAELTQLRQQVRAAAYVKHALTLENAQLDVALATYDGMRLNAGDETVFGKRKFFADVADRLDGIATMTTTLATGSKRLKTIADQQESAQSSSSSGSGSTAAAKQEDSSSAAASLAAAL